MKNKSNFFYANLIYSIIIFGFCAIRVLSSLNLLSFLGDYESIVLSVILQIGLMLILPIFLYGGLTKKKPKEVLNYYGVKKLSIGAIGISILIGATVYVLNIGVSSFFYTILQSLGYEKLSSSTQTESYPVYMLFVNLAMTAVLPAVCEEITHRGLLLKNYSSLGYKKAIILSGILFGLTHLNIEQFFYASIIGFVLGIITVLCGNIIPAMIIHFMNNAINVLVAYFVSTSTTFNAWYESIFAKLQNGNVFASIATLFVILLLLLGLMVFLIFKLFEQTAVKNLKQITEDLSRKRLRDELMGELVPEETSPDKVPMLVQHQNRFFNIYIPTDCIGYPLKQTYRPSLKEKSIFYGMLTTNVLITIFTFVWGVL